MDRLFESWLQTSGKLYGTGPTVVNKDDAGREYVVSAAALSPAPRGPPAEPQSKGEERL